MRVLAIGDIHGCSRALDRVLAAAAPEADDLVITLGDYVDRGPDSSGVIARLLAFRQTHRLVALRGNHDQLMLDARDGEDQQEEWLLCGGQQTLASYAVNSTPGSLAAVPASHWEFLETATMEWHETDTHFFVHANAFSGLPLAKQPIYMLLWEKLVKPRRHMSGKVMVCGHTAQKSGVPLNLGHAICIDTFVYGDGWLTCMDVTSGQIWQANQRGEQRAARIEDFGVRASIR